MMKQAARAALCAAAATVLVLSATASASSVHLKGGRNAEPSFTDNGLTLSGRRRTVRAGQRRCPRHAHGHVPT